MHRIALLLLLTIRIPINLTILPDSIQLARLCQEVCLLEQLMNNSLGCLPFYKTRITILTDTDDLGSNDKVRSCPLGTVQSLVGDLRE